MRLFRLHRGECVATFDPVEAQLVVDLVGQVRTLLQSRRDAAPDDPLAGITGLTVGPSTPPADPAVARLLPDFHREDAELAAGMRMLREPEVIAAKDDAAATLIATLSVEGGTVRLDEPTARAWLVALGDVRLVFGVRLGIKDEDAETVVSRAEKGSTEYAMYVTYRWLSTMQESLVEALLEAHHDDE